MDALCVHMDGVPPWLTAILAKVSTLYLYLETLARKARRHLSA